MAATHIPDEDAAASVPVACSLTMEGLAKQAGHWARLAARAGPIGRQFVAADRAEPGKERRFAAPRADLPHGDDERRLNDVLGGVFVAKPPRREVKQAREVGAEELVERALVAGSHALDELKVIHVRIRACVAYSQFPSPDRLRASCR